MMARDPRNPHGDQRRLTPGQRVLARNTRAGIMEIDRINAGNAPRIADLVRQVGARPLTPQDHQEIMRGVDQVLDATFGAIRDTTLGSPMGKAILRRCQETGEQTQQAARAKHVDRTLRALRRNPVFARELLRRYGR